MRFRKLRIAWSVTNGITCILLIVCWVVSYRFMIFVAAPFNSNARLMSAFGYWALWETQARDMHLGKWYVNYQSTKDQFDTKDKLKGRVPSGFGYYPMVKGGAIVARQWAPVLAFAGFTILPSFPSKFGLRTLLITTTLVAVVLGVIVWAAR